MEFIAPDQDLSYFQISKLYALRENEHKRKEYLAKISDDRRREFLYTDLIDHGEQKMTADEKYNILDDRHQYFIYGSDCSRCKHLKPGGDYTCPAFPEGIPIDLLSADLQHREVIKGQAGDTVFESRLETIFNHGVTSEEIKKMFPFTLNKAWYLVYHDQDTAYFDISRLYDLRKDEVKRKEYVEKISAAGKERLFYKDLLDLEEDAADTT